VSVIAVARSLVAVDPDHERRVDEQARVGAAQPTEDPGVIARLRSPPPPSPDDVG
jgi:hypothetical protein